MKKLLLFAVFLVVGQCVHAEKVLSVDLDVCRDDSVRVNYLALEDNYPTEFYRSGDYRLTIEDDSGKEVYETSFGIVFLLMSDPPVEINCSKVSASIPYKPEMRHISLYLKDRKILSRPISLCNNNGRCETDGENYLSCPKDCPLGKSDGICINEADGVCDPDCIPGADPDCRGADYSWIAYAVLVLVLLAFIALFVRRRREKKNAFEVKESFRR